MVENIKARTQEAMEAARDGRIPEQAREVAKQTVARSREAYERVNGAARDGFKDMEQAGAASYEGAKALSGKMLENISSNTEAAFEAAHAMGRAQTLPEAAQVYVRFMQQQWTNAAQQTQELLALSADVMRTVVERGQAAATKSMK